MQRINGFTFLEMLLATAIFAMFGLASVGILSNVTQSDEVSQQRLTNLRQLQQTMLLLERDLMQISARRVRIEGDPPKQERLWGEPFLLGSEDHGLSFTRQGWRNPGMLLPRSELQAVAYRLQDGQLQRLFTLYVDAVNDSTPQQQILLTDVESFVVSYWYNDKWEERWHHQYFPQAIRIQLTQLGSGEYERVFILPDALWRGVEG